MYWLKYGACIDYQSLQKPPSLPPQSPPISNLMNILLKQIPTSTPILKQRKKHTHTISLSVYFYLFNFILLNSIIMYFNFRLNATQTATLYHPNASASATVYEIAMKQHRSRVHQRN